MVVICILLALSKFSLVPWQTDLAFYGNKAGYTANTSRGRVGRGGNARFPTFRLERDGPTDGPTDRRTDKASYRVASPRLKTQILSIL